MVPGNYSGTEHLSALKHAHLATDRLDFSTCHPHSDLLSSFPSHVRDIRGSVVQRSPSESQELLSTVWQPAPAKPQPFPLQALILFPAVKENKARQSLRKLSFPSIQDSSCSQTGWKNPAISSLSPPQPESISLL